MNCKLCKDCKWCSYKEKTLWEKITFKYVAPPRFAKCLHEKAKETTKPYEAQFSLVDGLDRTEYNYCSVMRGKYHGLDLCGPDAKLFEPKG